MPMASRGVVQGNRLLFPNCLLLLPADVLSTGTASARGQAWAEPRCLQ